MEFNIFVSNLDHCFFIWAPSSEFVSSSIPSWQILTAHAQPSRGARDLAFCLKVPLDSLLVWASSEGSGETARMRRLAWTFAARIGDKYQIRLTRSIWYAKVIDTKAHSKTVGFKPVFRIIWWPDFYNNIVMENMFPNNLHVLMLFVLHALFKDWRGSIPAGKSNMALFVLR